MTSTKPFLYLYLVIFLFLCCSNPNNNSNCYAPHDLWKLYEKDLIKRANLLKPKNPYVVFKNCSGQIIDSIEMNLLNEGVLTTDKYVNENGIIIEEVVRSKTEEDEILDILIEEAYDFEDPYPYLRINCDSLEYILTAVYRSDQGKRTIDVPASEINNDFKDETIVINVIKQCGIPNKEDVSEDALISIFYVLQHATNDIMTAYYPYIRESAYAGNMKLRWLAMMQDRILLRHGKEQIYGTQFITDPISGEDIIEPMKNPKQVNKRREKMGMEPLSADFSFPN